MVLLFILLVLILAIPAVQTQLGKVLTDKLNSDFGTQLSIGRVGLQFNTDIELKDILILDYKDNTLISVDELNTSILNLKNLSDNKLIFGDIEIDGLELNLTTYKNDSITNLDVFIERFNTDDQSPKKPFLFSSSDITIANSQFHFKNFNTQQNNILLLNNLYVNATNLLIQGNSVSTRINNLRFTDSRGVSVENFSSSFSFTPEAMRLDNLSIVTKASELHGAIKFSYELEDLKTFTDSVQIDASFTKADILLDELNRFYNEFGVDQRARFTTEITGTLNELKFKNLRLNTSRNSNIYGDILFKNIFNDNSNNFTLKADLANLSSNYSDLKSLLPNVLGNSIPSTMKRLGNFTIHGTTQITSKSIQANFDMHTSLGLIKSDLTLSDIDVIDLASYKGNIALTDFDLGAFLNNENIKKTSFNLDVDGKGFTEKTLNTKLFGKITKLDVMGYEYSDIEVSGTLKNDLYKGKLISDDENLKLSFDGLADFSKDIKSFDFESTISYANLKALNIITNDSLAKFSGNLNMKVVGNTINDAIGGIVFNKATYESERGTYFFEDLIITSSINKNGIRRIIFNSPDVIQGTLSGKFKLENIETIVKKAFNNLYTTKTTAPEEISDQYLDFDFEIYSKIVELFYPNINLAPNTSFKGHVDSDTKKVNLTFSSPEIKLYNYFAKNIEVQIDNENPLFNTYVEIDSINTKFYNVSGFSLINAKVNDTLFIRSEFKGGTKKISDAYNLNLYHTVNNLGRSVIGVKQSEATVNSNNWIINPNRNSKNKIEVSNNFSDIIIHDFLAKHNTEEITLSGSLKGDTEKDITAQFKDVDLNKIIPKSEGLTIKGFINGSLNIFQKESGYLPKADIKIEQLNINAIELGTLNALITGNSELTQYDVDVGLNYNNTDIFSAEGVINTSNDQQTINLDAQFKNFKIGILNPLLEDILYNIRGDISGDLKITGNLKQPDINGDLIIENGGLGIPYLNIDYRFNEIAKVGLQNQTFVFDNLTMTDTKFNTKGILSGRLEHTNFLKWVLDLSIKSDRLLVLNTEESEQPFYGTGFMNGQARIHGPASELTIDVQGETDKGTVFKIPLNNAETFGDNTYIKFLTPEEKQAKELGIPIQTEEIKGVRLNFDLDITQEAEVELVIDKVSGSSIRGRGEGNLLIEINTNGLFKIYGDIAVFEGTYNFIYAGLIEKKFNIQPGGALAWDGAPLDTQLIDLVAVYRATTNPSPLLDNPINRSIPVDLEINLSGKLDELDPDFTFSFPTVSSSVRSELQYRLETKEERTNQALFLLSTGSFSSQLNDLSFTGTLTERLNSILNSFFSSPDNKLNIGLNLEAGENTPDYKTNNRIGFTMQTHINDRVILNGKIGVPVGGASETVVAGDVQIDFLLNEEGTLTAKVFNRENTIQNFGEDIGYTQGVGLSYTVDFDTFKELIQKIFSKAKKPENITKTAKEKNSEQKPSKLPEFIGVKKQPNNN